MKKCCVISSQTISPTFLMRTIFWIDEKYCHKINFHVFFIFHSKNNIFNRIWCVIFGQKWKISSFFQNSLMFHRPSNWFGSKSNAFLFKLSLKQIQLDNNLLWIGHGNSISFTNSYLNPIHTHTFNWIWHLSERNCADFQFEIICQGDQNCVCVSLTTNLMEIHRNSWKIDLLQVNTNSSYKYVTDCVQFKHIKIDCGKNVFIFNKRKSCGQTPNFISVLWLCFIFLCFRTSSPIMKIRQNVTSNKVARHKTPTHLILAIANRIHSHGHTLKR